MKPKILSIIVIISIIHFSFQEERLMAGPVAESSANIHRKVFPIRIVDPELRFITNLKATLEIQVPKPVPIKQEFMLRLVLKLDLKDSVTSWGHTGGLVSIAYDDSVGEIAGRPRAFAIYSGANPNEWELLMPPSEAVRYWSPRLGSILSAVIGVVPYVGKAFTATEVLGILLGSEAHEDEPYLDQNKYDVIELQALSSMPGRQLRSYKIEVPLYFTDSTDLPIHVRAIMNVRGGGSEGGTGRLDKTFHFTLGTKPQQDSIGTEESPLDEKDKYELQFSRRDIQDIKMGIWLPKFCIVNEEGEIRTILGPDKSLLNGELSPDGRMVAFSLKHSGDYDVYVANLGQNPKNITLDSHEDFYKCWSPDGERVLFCKKLGRQHDALYVIGRDGSNPTNVTAQSRGLIGSACYSPDGSKIAFVSGRGRNWDLYIMKADGTQVVQITNNEDIEHYCEFSPDSSTVLFNSSSVGFGRFDIFTTDLSGKNIQNLTKEQGSRSYSNPRWSPDGRLIAYNSDHRGNYDLYVMRPNGEGKTRLTNWLSNEKMPVWSPDGRKIAFISDHGAPEEEDMLPYNVCIMNTDGTGIRRLTHGMFRESLGGWLPRGGEAASGIDTSPRKP